MTTIMPQGEHMRQAVRYIAEKAEETGKPVETLVDDYAMRFNLSPKECDFLIGFFKQPCKPEE